MNTQKWMVVAASLMTAVLTGCPEQGVVCSAGLEACGEQCKDLQSDNRNCGACGVTCGAGEVCQAGGCLCPTGEGVASCDGACVTTKTDPKHCGACGNACNAGESCDEGQCVSDCAAGRTQCGQSCVDLDNDSQNCGACGSACPDPAHACVEGQCTWPVVAACFTNGQLVGFNPDLGVLGIRQQVGAAPQSLARKDGVVLVADGMDAKLYQTSAASLAQLDAQTEIGASANQVVVEGEYAYVMNSGSGTLQILKVSPAEADGAPLPVATVGEFPFGDNTWPQVMTKVGDRLYVTLYGGFDAATIPAGQKVVAVDVTDKADPYEAATYDLSNLGLRVFVPDTVSVPRPQGIVHRDGNLYVALNNLDPYYGVAGPGFVAVVPVDGGAISTIELPEDRCLSANWIQIAGDQLVVSCGGRALWDQSTWELSGVEATGVALINPDHSVEALSLSCPAESENCPVAQVGRFGVRNGKLYVADQNGGRLFVLAIEDGHLVEVRTPSVGEPLSICPVDPMLKFSNVGDVLSAR